MSYLITFLIFSLCFLGMALGLILAKKTLKKGCSTDPDSCACEEEGKAPFSRDQ